MPKIKLTILSSDIREAEYYDGTDCPITRALKRANIKGEDEGINIVLKNGVHIAGENYIAMRNKMIGMLIYERPEEYNFSEEYVQVPAEDFDWELEYPDEE